MTFSTRSRPCGSTLRSSRTGFASPRAEIDHRFERSSGSWLPPVARAIGGAVGGPIEQLLALLAVGGNRTVGSAHRPERRRRRHPGARETRRPAQSQRRAGASGNPRASAVASQAPLAGRGSSRRCPTPARIPTSSAARPTGGRDGLCTSSTPTSSASRESARGPIPAFGRSSRMLRPRGFRCSSRRSRLAGGDAR